MVFKGFIKFTGLPESKNGKNNHLKIFDVLFNPFTTEPETIFLLLENDYGLLRSSFHSDVAMLTYAN